MSAVPHVTPETLTWTELVSACFSNDDALRGAAKKALQDSLAGIDTATALQSLCDVINSSVGATP